MLRHIGKKIQKVHLSQFSIAAWALLLALVSGQNATVLRDGYPEIGLFPKDDDTTYFVFHCVHAQSDIGVHMFDDSLEPLWALYVSPTTPQPSAETPDVWRVSNRVDFAIPPETAAKHSVFYLAAHRTNKTEIAYGLQVSEARACGLQAQCRGRVMDNNEAKYLRFSHMILSDYKLVVHLKTRAPEVCMWVGDNSTAQFRPMPSIPSSYLGEPVCGDSRFVLGERSPSVEYGTFHVRVSTRNGVSPSFKNWTLDYDLVPAPPPNSTVIVQNRDYTQSFAHSTDYFVYYLQFGGSDIAMGLYTTAPTDTWEMYISSTDPYPSENSSDWRVGPGDVWYLPVAEAQSRHIFYFAVRQLTRETEQYSFQLWEAKSAVVDEPRVDSFDPAGDATQNLYYVLSTPVPADKAFYFSLRAEARGVCAYIGDDTPQGSRPGAFRSGSWFAIVCGTQDVTLPANSSVVYGTFHVLIASRTRDAPDPPGFRFTYSFMKPPEPDTGDLLPFPTWVIALFALGGCSLLAGSMILVRAIRARRENDNSLLLKRRASDEDEPESAVGERLALPIDDHDRTAGLGAARYQSDSWVPPPNRAYS